MKQKTRDILVLTSSGFIFLALVNLCGCTTNQNKNINSDANWLLGSWVGTLQIPLFGGDDNTFVSEITFSSDHAEMILTNGNRTFSMNYTYLINDNSLVLTPIMPERGRFPDRRPLNGTFPPNGTRASGNETQPSGDRMWLPNNTDPYNGTWPSNRTHPPGDNQGLMTLTFLYAFDEENKVLFLNTAHFTKV